MPSTLAQYRQEIHRRSNGETGRTVSITGLAGDTVTVARLASGTVTSGKYKDKWLLRPDAAPATPGADRERVVTAYNSAAGSFAHVGAAYNDTTVGTEVLEILEHEPWRYDTAIDVTVRSLMRADREVFPTRQGAPRYWLNDLTWIAQPRDILSVQHRPSRVLSRNRAFEKWNSVNTSGVLQADWWTISGASATYARSSSQVRTGMYSAAVTRSGTDCKLTQTVGLLDTGADSLRSETVTVVGVGRSAVASQLRFFITTDGGSTFTYTGSYHTGGSAFEELSKSLVIPASATGLAFGASVEGSNTEVQIDDCYLVYGAVSDSERTDDAPISTLLNDAQRYDQGAGTLAYIGSVGGWGGQLVFETMRPYPGFDATRLTAGTADADVQDAPLVTVALGALWRLYAGLYRDTGTKQHGERANYWRSAYEDAAVPHLNEAGDGRAGLPLPLLVSHGSSRRF